MRAFGTEDNRTGVTARGQRRTNGKDAAQFSMRPCLGRHRHGLHAGQRNQPMCQFVNNAKRTLDGLDRLQRMDIGKASHARDLFIQARVVLHRAATEREETEVNRVILTAKARIMAHRLRLRQAGKANVAVPFQITQARRDLRCIGKINAGCSGGANLENQCLFQH